MKVGDLVRHLSHRAKEPFLEHPAGLVVDIIQKKVWRSECMGKKVNWDIIDPEPHAVVLYAHNDGTINIPVANLKVVE